MLNTPNYNIPYPESSDAPDGANQMADIATTIDTALGEVDADLVTHSTGTNAADASTGSVHHTIGNGALNAAAGNHNHDNVYAYNLDTGTAVADSTDITISSTVSSSPTVIDTITFTLNQQTSVLLLGDCSLYLDGTLQSNYVYVGFRVDSNAISNTQITGGGNLSAGFATTQLSTHQLVTLSSGSHTVTLCGYRETSAITATASLYRITMVPIKALS